MDKLLEAIAQGNEVRANLIEVRQQLKQSGEKEVLNRILTEKPELLVGLLGNEDPKVRKNAALLIGDLRMEQMLEELYQAYLKEETLFIRRDYLKAMGQMDVRAYQERLEQRLAQMLGEDVSEENQKHYREELLTLQKLVLRNQKRKSHVFVGGDERFDVILTTNRNQREVTAAQIGGKKVSLVPLGVKVQNADIRELLEIRTFRELLFVLDIPSVGPGPVDAAKALAASDLPKVLRRAFGCQRVIQSEEQAGGVAAGKGPEERQPFYFRISIIGSMPLDKRSAFIKKCSFELEKCTGRRLVNTASDYELELRLLERRDGTFLPLMKLCNLPDPRFSYRKESIAASIHPSEAALIAALAKPYLKEKAQVLDPFCGVGTMLVERDRVLPAGTMYGIDIFGEAIQKARTNAVCADREIYYINRDFFDFTHEYLFDEIITNLPVRGKKTKEEQDWLYQNFFDKAEELLRKGGIMVLYSNEQGYVKKQLRLHEKFRLRKECCMNEKEGFYVWIIEFRSEL